LWVGLEASPTTVDPRLATDTSLKISQLIHNGLFRLTERLDVEPDLVEKFDFIPPQTYRFHLHSGVFFHNGQALTSQEVKGTLESAGVMEKIETIKIIDPLTLEVKLKEPSASFLSSLTIGIIPGDPSIGTGPFILDSWRPPQEISLRRNEKYFRLSPDQLQKPFRVIFRVIPDPALRLSELRRGQIDLLQDDLPSLETPQGGSGLVLERTSGTSVTYLSLNLKKGPLQKVEFRRAIAYAIDRQALAELQRGQRVQSVKGLYDPRKARALLADLPSTLTYKTSTRRDQIGLARLIARSLKEVGIEVKILPLEEKTFLKDVREGNFEICSLTWDGVTDPDGYFAAVQKVLVEEVPIIPLWYEDHVALFSNRVKNVKLRPNGSFEWATEVYKE